ncbi:serine/threonine protein kinase [Candidatus Uabimicrobium amorphum]|uniref:Serine/threonine protein kinase n=1 Tax=Uabimicrobium amorphum TaxID=2596890 RepID=A0A5S9IHW0_UABAM|nr:serine/threonine-protein kinase [Candidatus Uabimicrobium amorphum]BBM82073.1 serine/threonine protein kinase [Candidatus Uabimicrobium amorphum]
MNSSMNTLRKNIDLLLSDEMRNNKQGYEALQKIDFSDEGFLKEALNIEDEQIHKYTLWRILAANDTQHIDLIENNLHKQNTMAPYNLWTLLHLGIKSRLLSQLYTNPILQEIILYALVENRVDHDQLLREMLASDFSNENIKKYVLHILQKQQLYRQAIDHWEVIQESSLKKILLWQNLHDISLKKFLKDPWPLMVIDNEKDKQIKMYLVSGLYEYFHDKDILRQSYPANKRYLVVRLYRLLGLKRQNRTVLAKKTAMIRELLIAESQKRTLSKEEIKQFVHQNVIDHKCKDAQQFTPPQDLKISPPTSDIVQKIKSYFWQLRYAHDRAMSVEEVEVQHVIHEAIETEVEIDMPSIFGPYHIVDVLNEEINTIICTAHMPHNKNIVALKILRDAYDLGFKDKDFAQIKHVMSLNHPNIIRPSAIEKIDGNFAIITEYFNGSNIEYLVKKYGTLSPQIVVKLAIKILNALDYAHNNDIIHHDIRPRHILVDRKGTVKIIDFGFQDITRKMAQKCRQMLGEIRYISPEQLEDAKSVDARTDLFSLGGVLYFALTGIPPFGEEPPGKVIENILRYDPPPLCAFLEDIPQALDEAIMKCLAKKLPQRFSSAQEAKNAFLNIYKH